MRYAAGAMSAGCESASADAVASAVVRDGERASREIVEQWRSLQTGRRPASAPVRREAVAARGRAGRIAVRSLILASAIGLSGFGLYIVPQAHPLAATDVLPATVVELSDAADVSTPPPRPDPAPVDAIERVAATFSEIIVPIEMTQVVTSAEAAAIPLAIKLRSDRMAAFDARVVIENLPASARVEHAERLDEHTWEIETSKLSSARIVLPQPVAAEFGYAVRLSDRRRAATVSMAVSVKVAPRSTAPASTEPAEPPKRPPSMSVHRTLEAPARTVPSSSEGSAPKPKIADATPRRSRKGEVSGAERSNLGGAKAAAPSPPSVPAPWWQRATPEWATEAKTER